ncbi:MAG: hypothetical protein KF735_22740 [Chelatococcus sp.]|jgi:uncharacterized protein YndB with AHSA1/START domain|uniref:SRPBCC family protein n=1 Tax=unclassified Chelatococcus TaxID=2638111 RepID=UPI001BCEC854|nr:MULTISPECIES: hypothetical protein [unclassified Chelatococcus]CAH1672954.1 conserved hypothetical protein [Hyphomicrobiales bacterium]MBS7738885.1 hypothetical protein [Chelatococcus sp. HY11]MBX3540475.1 hypothetical protein [Chelatococcus sp.]MBX3547037.1 hypothetical protein [Chelatococcus sp.]MCO5076586.1 hypothetical protein [Chelatococcus sp.]
MSGGKTEDKENSIELEYHIDEPPHKVWRAITVPELRDVWLPKDALADQEATALTPGEEVSYRMRESAPPFLESTVTFRISPDTAGGTSLRIIHERADVSSRPTEAAAANDDVMPVLRAA